jgi:cell division protein FtsB
MGPYGNRLRRQVVSEVRKRRLIFFTVFLLTFIYILTILLFGDRSVIRYRELHKTRNLLELQIKEIDQENASLRAQIKSIKKDPFIKEKHAREDYGLAKPDELIFQYDR